MPSEVTGPSRGPSPSGQGDPRGPLALVMTGGGARAAYQVGFLRHLARRHPDLHVPIITGVSAGAINAVYLAAHPGTFREAVEELCGLWANLTVEDVFRVDARSLVLNVMKWGLQLVSGGLAGESRIRSLVDTAPLRGFLERHLKTVDGRFPGVEENLRSGRLRALALSTSSYTTGQSITWVQGREVHEWSRPQRRARLTTLTLEHVMASAALPLFFPAVRIGKAWYGDGGIRLSAPLSPALHLGAGRVLAISTRHEERSKQAERPEIRGYPPPAQVAGILLNAVFLDLMDQDAYRVEQMNRLLSRLPVEQREGLRIVDLVTLRPSRDLGRLANRFEPRLPTAFRFLSRGLGTRQTRSPDALSLLLFQPDYLRWLMRTGERDAAGQEEEIDRLVAEGGEAAGENQNPMVG